MIVKLSSLEEALAYLATYAGGAEADADADAPNVEFDGELSQLRIDIDGERYHATIPGELARGLWEYQEGLYKAVAFALYGVEDIRRLTGAQRREFELVFKVAEGSTDLIAPLTEFFKKLGEGFLTMESKHKACVLVAIAVVLTAGWGATHIIESQSSVKKDEIKATLDIRKEEEKTRQFEVLGRVAAGNAVVSTFSKASEEGARSIVRSAPDARNVRVGRINIDRAEIEEVNQRALKEKATASIIQEDFRVFGAYARDASATKYFLVRQDGAEFSVVVSHDDHAPADLEKIWAAARDRKPISMEVNLTLIRGVIRTAQIVKLL